LRPWEDAAVNLENDLQVRLSKAAGDLRGKSSEQRAWAESLKDTELAWIVEQGVNGITLTTSEGAQPDPSAVEGLRELVRACEAVYSDRAPDAM